MLRLFKKYWDVLGGTALGIGISYIVQFKLDSIQLTYSIILLVLVCIGLFEVVRIPIDKSKETKKRKNLVDTMVDNQTAMKAITIIQNPMKPGAELGQLIIDTKNEVKKMIRWIKNNIGALVTFILAVLTCIVEFVPQLGLVWDVNGYNMVTIITGSAAILVGLFTSGFTSSSLQEAINKAKETIKDSKITEDEKDKKYLSYIIKDNEKELEKLNKEFAPIKETYDQNTRLKLESDAELKNQYAAYSSKIATKTANISTLKARLAEVEQRIASTNTTSKK